MENIISQRVKKYPLTRGQRKIAEYLIQNAELVCSMSSLDVARETGTCDASVIRFARAIGFEGYADLKKCIYDSLLEQAVGADTLLERRRLNSENFSEGGSAEQFREIAVRSISSCFGLNREEEIRSVARVLREAKHRYVIGLRGCQGLAAMFARLLHFMLPYVTLITDSQGSSFSDLQDCSQEDAVVMFVFTRFFSIDLAYLKEAKERGARICLITNDITGPLNAYADHILTFESTGTTFFNSSVAPVFLAEYILSLIALECDFTERLNTRDKLTEDMRIGK